MKTKIFIMFTLMILGVAFLNAQTNVGKVSFLIGQAQFAIEGTNNWDALKMSSKIASNHVLKLIDDTEIEITWDNGETTELGGPKTVKVAELLKGLKVQTGWLDRVKKKVGILLTENENSNVRGVAGVRRTEVNIEEKDSLYWQPMQESNFNDGYAAFKDNNFERAAEIFEKVVLQNPLSKQAEISRACLVTIYTELKDKNKADSHLEAFLKDFPDSDLLSIMKESKK